MTGKYNQNGEVTSSSSHWQKDMNKWIMYWALQPKHCQQLQLQMKGRRKTLRKNINQCAFGKKEVNADGSVHSINWSQAVRESIKYYNASPKATGKELLLLFSCKCVCNMMSEWCEHFSQQAINKWRHRNS